MKKDYFAKKQDLDGAIAFQKGFIGYPNGGIILSSIGNSHAGGQAGKGAAYVNTYIWSCTYLGDMEDNGTWF